MANFLPLVRDSSGNIQELPAGGQIQALVVYVSDTSPATASGSKSMWWCSTDGKLYIDYNDGNTSQWIEVVSSGQSPGAAGPHYKSASFSAAVNSTYMVNTTSGGITVTLPSTSLTVGDTINIIDAANKFGTYNCTISGSSNIDGITFTGSSSVVLNCPGNNATLTWTGSAWKCVQVANGHWATSVASSATSVEFTGLPGGNVNFSLCAHSISGTITDPGISFGYGGTPTYPANGVYSYTQYAGAATFRTGVDAATGLITPKVGAPVGAIASFSIEVTTGSSTNVSYHGYTNWHGQEAGRISGATSALTGYMTSIKVERNSTFSFSGTFVLKWIKNNV